MKRFVTINADIEKGKINKNIYGHFAEHLGRCIYEGIWVLMEKSELNMEIRGLTKQISNISGKILTANEKNAHNTFEQPENVKPVDFADFTAAGNILTITLPPMAVVSLEIEKDCYA